MSHSADKTVIAVHDFSFRIGKKEILRHVSFSVREGEYLTIIGPNGAGKTTLLKCLDRILTGGSGSIEVFGKPLASYSQKQLAQQISYVPQSDGRVFPFTVEEFVLMGRYPHLSPFSTVRKEDWDVVHSVLDETGTRSFAQRVLNTLSGGERQKVYVAAALAQGARVLLLDEPTTFLDYRHQAELRELLGRLNRQSQVTILAVTHDVNSAALESDRVVALCDGEVAFCGPPREVMKTEVLERIYGTRLVMVDHPITRMPLIVPESPAGRLP